MITTAKPRISQRARRHARVRARVHGTKARPRLAVFRSSKHIYAQLIDDTAGRTIAMASDIKLVGKSKIVKLERARAVGAELAKLALAKKIKQIAFDRGGYLFAGRVRAVAEGARAAGLIF